MSNYKEHGNIHHTFSFFRKILTPKNLPQKFDLQSVTRTSNFSIMAKDASNAAHSSEKNPFLFSSGDVTLLKTHPKTKQSLSGTVLSHALTLASPVWKKFLFPPWEANDAEPKPKQIDCREDDSSALLLLLSIAHLQFNEVPKGQLEYSLLFEVAKLCDQYDCVDLVRPWLRDWLAGEEIECLKVGKEGWLWISWVFGREKAFEACAKNLAKLVSTDKNGGCFLENGKPIPEPVPAGIVGKFCPSNQMWE
jgi:hypothetical protein